MRSSNQWRFNKLQHHTETASGDNSCPDFNNTYLSGQVCLVLILRCRAWPAKHESSHARSSDELVCKREAAEGMHDMVPPKSSSSISCLQACLHVRSQEMAGHCHQRQRTPTAGLQPSRGQHRHPALKTSPSHTPLPGGPSQPTPPPVCMRPIAAVNAQCIGVTREGHGTMPQTVHCPAVRLHAHARCRPGSRPGQGFLYSHVLTERPLVACNWP